MNPLQFLDIAIWLPIPFAFLVLGLMVLLRGENRFAGMLVPFIVVTAGSVLYVPAALLLRDWILSEYIAPNPDMEFLLRRTSEPFSDLVIGIPVLFAFGVLGLIVLLRREHRFAGMLLPFIVVTVLSVVYVPLALTFKPYFSWWVILVPLLLAALVYVVLMYLRDAQTISPAWAGFLGLFRCAVYAILAFVFLLPGCQSFDKTETYSKVIFLFDVSGSMNARDDFPEIGQEPASVPTRQDKVIKLLTSQAAFVQKVLDKSPITAYRFGSVADEADVLNLRAGQTMSAAEWAAWLKPDKKNIKVDPKKTEEEQLKERAKLSDLIDSLTGGTNVGGAALQVAKAESGSFTQAIVIFSDGQSNVGSDEATKEFLARAGNPKRPIQVFTVGVGEYRQPASIRMDEGLQAPEIARPDDKFPVRVPVVGSGLQDEDFDVTLEFTRVEDGLGRPVVADRKFVLGPKKGKFKGGGDHPNDTVEFEIDLQELRGLKSVDDVNGDLEGTWQFIAKVPRHAREAFEKAEHVSEPPTRVLVQKKKLRILLFAGGPGRDYQFVRTLLYREVNEKRIEMSIFLQTGHEDHVDQDVESDRLLARFPDTLGPSKEKYMSLNDYDVIVAFDADWTALDVGQLKMVKDWVGTHAGGIIFVAGPVHTFHLARPGGLDLSSLLTIYPVVLRDSRLHNAGIGHDPTKPYPLRFGPAVKLYDFLKLDEAGESPTAGWDDFFWGAGKSAPEPGKYVKPMRGFFNYYPVERIKPASIVLATFEGPENSRINDGKDAQPYIVTMPYGNGKTLYVGSAESYRIRSMPRGETFHERFWIKLCRFASAGTTAQKKYGRILLGRNVPTGDVPFEAQIKGEDLQPLARDSRPTVYVKKIGDSETKPAAFDLKAKPTQGDWQGWFLGKYNIKEPGEYEFKIPISGTNEALSHRLTVRKPNLEMDNLKHNHGALYQISSDAAAVLNRLTGRTRDEVQKALGRPVSEDVKESPGKETSRLFFPLTSADQIPRCLINVPPHRESTKGALHDLWDRGYESGLEIGAYELAMLIPGVVGLLGAGILLFLRQFWGAAAFLGAALVIVAGVALFGDPEWVKLPVDFSFVLVTVVTLLSVEWLTRKLLKLA
jgi:hypothetical protein